MERYETEEQQVEAIKQFWKDNGIAIIVGAVIGLGGLWGWRYYNQSQMLAQEQASDAYEAQLDTLVSDQAVEKAEIFIAQHGDSGYAVLTSFIAAQQAIQKNDLDKAISLLNKAVEQSPSQAISDLALLRLARVQLAQSKHEEALSTLAKVKNDAFAVQVNELKGDAYLAANNIDAAKLAYAAVLAEDESNLNVKMKADNLAYVATTGSGE